MQSSIQSVGLTPKEQSKCISVDWLQRRYYQSGTQSGLLTRQRKMRAMKIASVELDLKISDPQDDTKTYTQILSEALSKANKG